MRILVHPHWKDREQEIRSDAMDKICGGEGVMNFREPEISIHYTDAAPVRYVYNKYFFKFAEYPDKPADWQLFFGFAKEKPLRWISMREAKVFKPY